MITAIKIGTVIVVVVVVVVLVVVVVAIEAAVRHGILSCLVVSSCDCDNDKDEGQTLAKLDSFAQNSASQDI